MMNRPCTSSPCPLLTQALNPQAWRPSSDASRRTISSCFQRSWTARKAASGERSRSPAPPVRRLHRTPCCCIVRDQHPTSPQLIPRRM